MKEIFHHDKSSGSCLSSQLKHFFQWQSPYKFLLWIRHIKLSILEYFIMKLSWFFFLLSVIFGMNLYKPLTSEKIKRKKNYQAKKYHGGKCREIRKEKVFKIKSNNFMIQMKQSTSFLVAIFFIGKLTREISVVVISCLGCKSLKSVTTESL